MIYICAGHTNLKGKSYDPGAIGNGYKESELTVQLRDLICVQLQKLGATFKTDNDEWSLAETIAHAGTTEKDVVFDIHFNAATPAATGCEVLVPNESSQIERDTAQKIVDTTCHILGIANRKVKNEGSGQHHTLGIMRPKACNMLWEVCFITNKSDLETYFLHQSGLAQAIAKILFDADNAIK